MMGMMFAIKALPFNAKPCDVIQVATKPDGRKAPAGRSFKCQKTTVTVDADS